MIQDNWLSWLNFDFLFPASYPQMVDAIKVLHEWRQQGNQKAKDANDV